MRFSIEVTADPAKEDSDFVFEALQQFNFRQVGNDKHQLLRIFTRNENGELVGGLLGDTYWGWLYIAIVWVREDCRKQGLGKQMLARAEAEAVQRGCLHAHLDTMDFQAPDFYLRLGYTIWGELEDLPRGHRRIFLKKALAAEEPRIEAG